MSNTYRALTPAAVAAFDEGVFERDFTPTEERDWLDAGLLELVPRKYRVLSDNYERPKDDVFEAALLVEVEAAQVAAGHIERVDDEEVDEEPDEDEPDDVEPEEEPEAVADEPAKEEE